MARERYTHGHHGSVVSDHARRSANDSAGFLLAHLGPDLDLLDIGCGPGSITLDLSRRVRSVCGIDASSEAIRVARDAAAGRSNVRFLVADVYALPFADSSFDVVFAHQVLQHLRNPVAALSEARRVVRPGGLVAARDADYGTMVHDPREPRVDRWAELYDAVARRSGGEPHAGRMLARWFGEAGFEDLTVTTSTWTYHDSDAVERWARLWESRLLEARLGDLAVEYGLSTREELHVIAGGWREWATGGHPFFAFLHGEVIGVA